MGSSGRRGWETRLLSLRQEGLVLCSGARRVDQPQEFLGQGDAGVKPLHTASSPSTHFGLALHWVSYSGRLSIPYRAAAGKGGPSYFVDTWNKVQYR